MPSSQSCLRLADAFGVDPDTVLAIAGHRPAPAPANDPKANLIALIRRADIPLQTIAALEAMITQYLPGHASSSEPRDHTS